MYNSMSIYLQRNKKSSTPDSDNDNFEISFELRIVAFHISDAPVSIT